MKSFIAFVFVLQMAFANIGSGVQPGGPDPSYQPPKSSCTAASQCPYGMTCVMFDGGKTQCQITTGGYIPGNSRPYYKNPSTGGLDSLCLSDSDCSENLQCVDYHGTLMCKVIVGKIVSPQTTCFSHSDCPAEQQCVYVLTKKQSYCLFTDIPSVGGFVTISTTTTPVEVTFSATKHSSISTGKFATSQSVVSLNQDDEAFHKFAKYMTEAPPTMQVPTYDIIHPKYDIGYKDQRSAAIHGFNVHGLIDTLSNNDAPGQNVLKTKYQRPFKENDEMSSIHKRKNDEITEMTTQMTRTTTAKKVLRETLIDPAALPCNVDYQCRMGESCSGLIRMVDRNVTVCVYDVTKQNRLCLRHADCLKGQRCSANETGTFVCTASAEVAMGGVKCQFDFDCSGGEKCTAVGLPKHFFCRESKFEDPRRNGPCKNNAECPFMQVCRRMVEVFQCVNLNSTLVPVNSNMQRRLFQFVQDLLFNRFL